jgi:hypothetical protein
MILYNGYIADSECKKWVVRSTSRERAEEGLLMAFKVYATGRGLSGERLANMPNVETVLLSLGDDSVEVGIAIVTI